MSEVGPKEILDIIISNTEALTEFKNTVKNLLDFVKDKYDELPSDTAQQQLIDICKDIKQRAEEIDKYTARLNELPWEIQKDISSIKELIKVPMDTHIPNIEKELKDINSWSKIKLPAIIALITIIFTGFSMLITFEKVSSMIEKNTSIERQYNPPGIKLKDK